MLLFLVDFAAYLLTLVASFVSAGSVLCKMGEVLSPTAQSLAVVLVAPLACWGLGIVHWKAYSASKVLLVKAISMLSHFGVTLDQKFSELLQDVQVQIKTTIADAVKVLNVVNMTSQFQPAIVVRRKALKRSYDPDSMFNL